MSSANACENPPLDYEVVSALLTLIEVSTFYFLSIFYFTQKALDQNAYHQHITAMQMLDFNLNEGKNCMSSFTSQSDPMFFFFLESISVHLGYPNPM